MINGKLFRLQWLLMGFIGLSFMLTVHSVHAAAKPRLIVNTASWSAKKQTLIVKGKYTQAPAGASIELFDINGRRLGIPALTNKGAFSLSLSGIQLAAIPCSVRASASNLENIKPVIGAPKSCAKSLGCQITQPLNGFTTTVNTPVSFNAKVKLPKKIKHPKYEWDFAGGAMGEELTNTGLAKTYQRPDSTQASVAFVRNNSHYRVRFSVVDGDASPSVGTQQYRCEDSVHIVVGKAPDVPPGVAPMAAASVASAPAKASEANGEKDDLVVLPFQDWTMQNSQDSKVGGNWAYVPIPPILNTLQAQVIKKGSVGASDGPQLVNGDAVELKYSSASNTADPTGNASINSTSQNWPLNTSDTVKSSPLLAATIQKTDLWEIPVPPATDPLWKNYGSNSLAQYVYAAYWMWFSPDPGLPRADEGYFPHFTLDRARYSDFQDYVGGSAEEAEASADGWFEGEKAMIEPILARIPPGITHGSYMPGLNNPYVANETQPFTLYDSNQQRFEAQTVPVTDVDDQGQINPEALLRVEAISKTGDAVSAKTDAVLSTGRDLHCRGCHAKGQIAANPNANYKPETYLSGSFGKASSYLGLPVAPTKPDFWTVEELGGDSTSLLEQEYAAMRNLSSLHAFYDGGSVEDIDYIYKYGYFGDGQPGGRTDGQNGAHVRIFDAVVSCTHCHASALQASPRGDTVGLTDNEFGGYDLGDGASYSVSMHRFHGEMQYNADKTDILRTEKGTYARFDHAGKPRVANADINPKTLFPIFGADGKQLPMEQNCLKCHAGHREPLYNDRMYTAGVTCFDCHGDMLSQGGAFTKNAGKTGSKVLADYRKAWMDEPDCGSCHVGNANTGKTDTAQFFSGGVRKRAFADTDPAATSYPVNKADPDAVRFAVVPDHEMAYLDYSSTSLSTTIPVKVDAPLYRYGKDTHGEVACAACHGAAHAVAPNRDPSANDNVTALQLQGYPGHILECNVCHTKDAFKDLANLDGSTASGWPEGVLGGPHNLHPVNDPNWYLQRTSGTETNTDGTQYGGWHNVVSRKPGVKNEDQCAACHGDDHLGTRLSKTPVDRVFDFSSLDFKKLKKLGFKKKVIKVAAGSVIGCNTCHSVETSKLKTPTGPVANRHSPVISATPAPTVIIGETFSYQVMATDADSDALNYSLSGAPDGMSISGSGKVSWSHAAANPDDAFGFKVLVSDAGGVSVTRWFIVKPSCPESAQYWDAGLSLCSPLQITSTAPAGETGGLNAGQPLNYTATSSSPASFSIIDTATSQTPTFAPLISINANTGAISWTPDTSTPATVNFRILATANDNPAHKASQDISLSICQLPQLWDVSMWMCMVPTP